MLWRIIKLTLNEWMNEFISHKDIGYRLTFRTLTLHQSKRSTIFREGSDTGEGPSGRHPTNSFFQECPDSNEWHFHFSSPLFCRNWGLELSFPGLFMESYSSPGLWKYLCVQTVTTYPPDSCHACGDFHWSRVAIRGIQCYSGRRSCRAFALFTPWCG